MLPTALCVALTFEIVDPLKRCRGVPGAATTSYEQEYVATVDTLEPRTSLLGSLRVRLKRNTQAVLTAAERKPLFVKPTSLQLKRLFARLACADEALEQKAHKRPARATQKQGPMSTGRSNPEQHHPTDEQRLASCLLYTSPSPRD